MAYTKNNFVNEEIVKTYKALEMTDKYGWKYKILKTHEDFINETKIMNNCLINCGYKNMIDGKGVIIVATTNKGNRINVELETYWCCIIFNQMCYEENEPVSKEDRKHIENWLSNQIKKL